MTDVEHNIESLTISYMNAISEVFNSYLLKRCKLDTAANREIFIPLVAVLANELLYLSECTGHSIECMKRDILESFDILIEKFSKSNNENKKEKHQCLTVNLNKQLMGHLMSL